MNPFRFGVVVEGDQFFNREKEVAEIKFDLKSGVNLIIYSPRRYGKTSLIYKVKKELEKEGHICIYIDFFKIYSEKRFIEIFGGEIIKNQGTLKKAIQKFREFIQGIIPQVTFDQNGEPKISFQFVSQKIDQTDLARVIDFPEKISDNGKKVIVIFDEFQEIENLNGDSFEKILRSQIQFHNHTSYVFMGSKTHLLLNMFQNKEKALYKSGKFYPLAKIDENEMSRFISMQFEKNGFEIDIKIAKKIVEYAYDIPHYIQQLSYQIWSKTIESGKKVSDEDLVFGVDKIIDQQYDYYLEIFNKLSPYQKKVLRALTNSAENVYSSEYTLQHDLSGASSTQRAIAKLTDIGIINKQQNSFSFTDPFFRMFLQKKIFI